MQPPSKQHSPIVVIDDDVRLLSIIETTLLRAKLPVPVLVPDSNQAMDIIRQHSFSVAIIDLIMPNTGGMELLQQVKTEFPGMECIILTAVNEAASAVEALRYGAYDYLVKPVDAERLLITINRALEKFSLKQGMNSLAEHASFAELANRDAFSSIVTEDVSMARVFMQAEAAAATEYNVILTGESGTGKELLARILHGLSPRSRGPFVPVNMSAFPKTLFEGSFFGHAKGAFTGAQTQEPGLLQTARKGTIFLDEITEMDPGAQAKILRVIQEREYFRLGSSQIENVDVRFLAASNRDLKQEIKQGRFREDLYYRLNMFHIHLPPLRERRKDIAALAAHFLKLHAVQNGKDIQSISPAFLEVLQQYSFPGNVRELESIIARAVLQEKDSVLTLSSSLELMEFENQQQCDSVHKSSPLTLNEVEKKHIEDVLTLKEGNRTHAARALGISLRTLHRKLVAFGIK